MNRSTYIQIILCLKQYLTRICGIHYPIEIIKIITMISYAPIKISCGRNHTAIIVDGQIYIWGCNISGEVGLENTCTNVPKKLPLSHIKKIYCTDSCTFALTNLSELYVWGYNKDGQLGICTKINQTKPHKIILPHIKKICSSGYHTIVLTTYHKLYAWGLNSEGQLGLGFSYFGSRLYPQEPILNKISQESAIKKIFCGRFHTIILLQSGQLYGWGANRMGQLGLPLYSNYHLPQELTLKNVTKIDCGYGHTVALTSDSKCYVRGNNKYGQLGLGDTNPRYRPTELNLCQTIVSVKCGANHTIALTTSNQIYVWGRNKHGQLGLAVRAELPAGRFADPGDTNTRISPHKLSLSNITRIKCGFDYTVAISTDEKVYVWGSNDFCQLGLTDNIDRDMPTELKF